MFFRIIILITGFVLFAFPNRLAGQEITFNVDSLSFGSVELQDSVSRLFQITNTGSDVLSVDSILFAGADANEFIALSPLDSFDLGPVGRRNFHIRFLPQNIGIKDARLEFYGNQVGPNPAVIPFQAEAIPIPPPDISANVLAINYGTLQLGDTLTRFLGLQNVGQSNLLIDTLVLAGADTVDFNLLSDPSPFTLVPAQTRVLRIEFDPMSEGDKFANLPIFSNDPDENPLVISLEGSAFDSSRIIVDPPNYDFGDVLLGDSISTSFTIRNEGGKDLVVSDFEMLWVHRDDFPIQTQRAPFTLPPDSSKEIEVLFRPLELGSREGRMQIRSNDPFAPQFFVAVFGVGLDSLPEPEISIDPISHDYGTVILGDTVLFDFFVKNIGTGNLSVDPSTWEGDSSDFVILAGDGPYVLEPDEVRRLQIWFIPKAGGSRNAILNIPSDAVNADTLSVPLSGTGLPVPDIRVEQDSLDIGFVVVDSSGSADIGIRNIGTANLEILEFLFEDADAAYFSVNGVNFPYTIIPNDTAWLPVTFSPDSVRTFEAHLTIISDDPDEDSVRVRVFGEGVPVPLPDIDFANDSLLFAETALTTVSTDSLRIFNSGIADLVLSGLKIRGQDSTDFQLSMQSLPSTIAPGDSANLLIDFLPQAVGERNAKLEILSNDPDESPAQVVLSGAAVAIPVADIVISSDTLDFGAIDIGDFTFRELLIQNLGTADLEVSSAGIMGIDSSAFAITFGEAPFTVEPGDSQRIDIRFLPFDLGERTAELNLLTNDPDELTISVPLLGAALDTTLIDTLAPVCSTYTTIVEEEQVHIAVVDTGSGMKTIDVLISENMDVVLPVFTTGEQDTLLVIATRIVNQDLGRLQVAFTDRKNNVSYCEVILDSISDIEPEPGLPDVFALKQNYPNPFNPSTEIEFSIPTDNMNVRLEIYDVMGRHIQTLVDGSLISGFYTVSWDGRDRFGRRAASGVYIYRLSSDSQSRVRKMLLVR